MVNIKLDENATTPRYESSGAAGFDLCTTEDVWIRPFEIALLPTGVVVETPRDHMLILALRSSSPKKFHVTMPHGVGIVDEDYCGNGDELKIQVMGLPHSPDRAADPRWSMANWLIPAGSRIAQGIFVPIARGQFQAVEDMRMQSRGGFGSTGV